MNIAEKREGLAEVGASTKQPVDRACLPCRLSHLACDSSRPCKRCTSSGKAAQCVDPERRRRGRPRKNRTHEEGEIETTAGHGAFHPQPQAQQPHSHHPQQLPHHLFQYPPQAQAPPVPQHCPPYPQPGMPYPAGFAPAPASSASSLSSSSSQAPPSNAQHPQQPRATSTFSFPHPVGSFPAPVLGGANSTFPPSPQSFPFPFPPFPLSGVGRPQSPPPFPSPFPQGTSPFFFLLLVSPILTHALQTMGYAGLADPPFPPFPVQPKPSHQPPSLSSSAPPGLEPTTSSRADGRSETTKKQKRTENPSLLAAAEGSSSSPSNSSPASHEQPKGGTGADIESLLGILVGQVRDLKDSLKGVQKELKAVNKRQKMFEDHHRQLKERVELLIPLVAARASQSPSDGGGTSPPSSVSSPEQASLLKLTAHPHIPAIPFPLPRSMPRTRAEILDYFPLLKSYESLYSPDAPFVIDEFTKPIAIVLFVSPPEALVHKFLPPIYIYVNDAFCELLRYPLSEILACPVTKFSMPSEDNRANIMASLAEARPNGFSSITTFSPYAIKRDGTVIKLHGRHQMFFNETAHPKWGVMVVDSVSEENVFVEVRKVALQTLLNEFTASRHSAGLPTGFPTCNFPGFPLPFPHGFGPDSASALMPASPLRQSLSMSAAFSAAAVAAAAVVKRKRAPDDDGTEHEGTAAGENKGPDMPDGYGFVPSTPPALFQIQGLYSPSFLSGAEGAQQHHQGAHNAGGRRTEDNERAELRDLLAGLLSSPMPSPPPSSLSFSSGAGGDGDAPSIGSLNFYNFGTSLITPVSPPPPSSPVYSAGQLLRDRRDFT